MATAKKRAVAKPAPAKKAVRRASPSDDDEMPVRGKKSTRVVEDGPDVPLGEIGEAASAYFASMDKEGIQFVSAGAALIDCMLGGGWACGRVANVVGDKSAGKTLLAIEATANFHILFAKALKRYAESEAAFDEAYANALGMPIDAVEFATVTEKDKETKKEITRPLRTIEDWYLDLKDFCARVKKTGLPGLYILDSLDALSDQAEQGRAIDEGTYGGTKPKKLGELFRRLVADVEDANVLLIVVSQLRDKIGAMFGEKQTRSGGRALDFYASHIVWLAEIGKIEKTIDGVKRKIGVKVKARVKKNKVGLPFRECEYPILFGYGVDDLTANVEWLLTLKGGAELVKREFDMSEAGYDVRIANLRNKGGEPVRELRAKLRAVVIREWQRVENSFLPKARKY